MSTYIVYSLIPLILVLFVQVRESNQIRTVHVRDSVQFSCQSDQRQRRIWEHDSKVLFLDDMKIDFDLDQIELLSNYSLVIQEVAFKHEGTYRCLQNGSIVEEFVLRVQVPPKLFLTNNGADNLTCLNVEAGTDVTLFCHAVGAIPAVNLSWTSDEENGDHRELNFTVEIGGEYEGRQVFDSISANRFKLVRDTGVISCISSADSGVGNREASLQYNTYVSPKLFLTSNRADNVTYLNVEAGTDVTLFCHAVGAIPPVNLSWTSDEANEDHRRFNFTVGIGGEYEGRQVFDSISANRFKLVRDNGVISCISDSGVGNREISLRYQTFVIPELQISIDGFTSIKNVPLAADEPVQVICNVSSPRQRFSTSLFVNNVPIEGLEEMNEMSPYMEQNSTTPTFRSVFFAWYKPEDANGSITCASYFNTTEVTHASATFVTYVVPEMFFTINGNKWRNSSTIKVTSNQMMTITCQANGARPVIQLVWKMNTVTIDTKSVPIRNIDNQTFNISTVLEFLPNETERDVTCFTRGLFNRNEFISVYIQVTDSDSYHHNTPSWKIIVIVLVSILLSIVAPSLMFLLRRYFGARFSHSLHEYQAHWNINPNVSNSLSEGHPRKHGLKELELPELPGGTDISDYYPFTEDDYDSYFELKDKSSRHRMFRGKDMCLILSMNSGNLQRWMGTISPSINDKKCVVFSTVSDNAVKKGEIRWDTYVKRVLDMPDHNSLVKLEGICVSQDNLYLVHEHLTCDSLESIISSKRITNNRHGPLSTSEVASYLRDILEGIEVLHSFGFLHPGLSTKKVLVTDKGRCKLYNFFLAEDAPNKTSNMKSMKDCSIADLPPEALLRNEYTQASDAWCVAVVIWNLMTYDPIPVVLNKLDERNVSNVDPEWPSRHPGLKNHILFECWMYDEKFRPSINKLRSSFQKVFENVKTFTSSVDLKETTTDLYIPMDGMKEANQ